MKSLDQNQTNRDWIKTQHWDLSIDFDQFLFDIGGAQNLPHFMTLPAAQAMPADLRYKVDSMLPAAKSYDPSEARDERGRFSSENAPTSTSYTEEEKAAAKIYAGTDYDIIQDQLRTPDKPAYESKGNQDRLEKTIKDLDSAIAKSKITEERTVYRGIMDWDTHMSGLVSKGSFTSLPYSSTTPDDSIANEFAKGPYIKEAGQWRSIAKRPGGMMKIILDPGTTGLEMREMAENNRGAIGAAAKAKELLLPRNTTFHVESYDPANRVLTVRVKANG